MTTTTDQVEWIDEDDRVREIVSRERAHQEGLLHRAAVVYCVRENGQILVQERADTGQLDHSAAGHVDPGESYEASAARELEEELGISNVPLTEVGIAFSDEQKPWVKKHVRHIYKIFSCIAEPRTLNREEVTRVFWVDPDQIWQEMRTDPEIKGKYCGGFKATMEVYLAKRTIA